MIIEMLANVVLWINAFLPSSGVSNIYSPRTIMNGTALDFHKHCQIPFGAYVEVCEDRDTTNTISERTQPAICLGPTANFQGSYKFLSLTMGKCNTRKKFKELPMPDSIIQRVEAMTIREKQDKTITFSDRSGESIPDLHASPDTSDIDSTTGVNDGSDDDDGREGDNEGPGIAIGQNENEKQNEIEAPNEDTEYGGVPGVTAIETPTGVTTEVTGVPTT
jgi:hypothetical protein